MYILLYFLPITHSQTRHPHALSHRIYATHSPGRSLRQATQNTTGSAAVTAPGVSRRAEPYNERDTAPPSLKEQ